MRAGGLLVAFVLIAAAAVYGTPLRLQRHHRTRTTALSALALGARDGYDEIATDVYAAVVTKFKALAATPPGGAPPHNDRVACVQDSAHNPLCTAHIVRAAVAKFNAAADALRRDIHPQCVRVEALECQLKDDGRWQANFFCMSGPTPADIKWNVHLPCVDSKANGGIAVHHVNAEKKLREDAAFERAVALGRYQITPEVKQQLAAYEELMKVTPEEKQWFEDSLAASAAQQKAREDKAAADEVIRKKLQAEAAKTTGPGKKKYDKSLYPRGRGLLRMYDPYNPTSSGRDMPRRDAAIIAGAFPTEVAAYNKKYGVEEKKDDDEEEKKEEAPKAKKPDSAPASGSVSVSSPPSSSAPARKSKGQRFVAWMCSWGSCTDGVWSPLPDASSCSAYGCIRCMSRSKGCGAAFIKRASAWCCPKAKAP